MCLLSYGFPKIVVVYTQKTTTKMVMRKLWEHLEIPLIKGQRFLLHLLLVYAGDEEKLLHPKWHSGQNQAKRAKRALSLPKKISSKLRKSKLNANEVPIPVLMSTSTCVV